MKNRFAYFYFMKQKPETIQSVAPAHIAYWKELNLKGYFGGPFSDRSGGMITFEAEHMQEATRIVAADPFVLENLLEMKWIKVWLVE